MIGFNAKALDKALNDIAISIMKQIKDNTRKGIDYQGKPFKAYSKQYREQKADYMSRGEGEPTRGSADTVNLMLTGVMIDSISTTKEGKDYVIYIADANRKLVAYAHHYGKGRLPERKFFSISKQNEKRIYDRTFSKLSLLVKK